VRGLPLSITSMASVTTAPSTQPPDTEPRKLPWSSITRLDPTGRGNFLGSVSGGCVEGAVVTEAMDVIESGKPRTLEFGVADETAWKVGLSCGGKIRVFVEKVE